MVKGWHAFAAETVTGGRRRTEAAVGVVDIALLREALAQRPLADPDEEIPGDLAVEQMGDGAVDWILAEVRSGGLTPNATVRGLRLLSRLTRQFCVPRKGEILDLLLELAQEPSTNVEVRSCAIQIAMGNVVIARGLVHAARFYGRSVNEVKREVTAAARRALELGVVAEVDQLVRAFLKASQPE